MGSGVRQTEVQTLAPALVAELLYLRTFKTPLWVSRSIRKTHTAATFQGCGVAGAGLLRQSPARDGREEPSLRLVLVSCCSCQC